MAAPSNTTGIAGMHPTMGLQLEVRAAFFGEDWAKEKFGDDWESARLEGVVRDFQRGKTAKTDKWKVYFAFDNSEYWWKRSQMVEVGVPPRLMESEGGAAEIEAVDLRTPQSKARVEPSKEQGQAGPDRPRRAVRPPSRYTVGGNSAEGDAKDDAEEDMEEEGQSNDGGSDEGGDKGAEETVERLPRVPLPRDSAFQKRDAKKKGRKRVSLRLLEGNSDEEEGEFSDNEQLAKEGDPLETVVDAGPSALWEWRGVKSGDARTNLQPAPWQRSRSRVPRTLLSNLATLNPF